MKSMTILGVLPLLLSGCMMLGSGGMGHGSSGGGGGHAQMTPMSGPMLIKESVVEGIRITAEFPRYSLGDDVSYRVTLRRERDSTAITDASVTMLIGRDDTRDRTTSISPSARGTGVYEFRPVLTAEGVYRVVIRVERVGNAALPPGTQLEQLVRLDAPMDMARETHGNDTSRWAPTALLGVGLMAVMMLVMFR